MKNINRATEIWEAENYIMMRAVEWLTMGVVDADATKNKLQLTLDSGAEVHIIPLHLVTKRMRWATGPQFYYGRHSGEQLKR